MKTKVKIVMLTLILAINAKSQTLNYKRLIETSGTADSFTGGYTFSRVTAGTPYHGALISFGGFENRYDCQINSDYIFNRISFRTRNGDSDNGIGNWNPWHEIATVLGNNNFEKTLTVAENVGIGTTNPLAKLEISNGSVLVRSDIQYDNASAIMIGQSIINGTLTTYGTSIRTITENAGNNKYGMQFFTQEDYHTGQTEKVRIQGNGNVGIGTKTPDSKLTVAGNIHAQEVKVTVNAGVIPDYVFANGYKLKTLNEIENFIKSNSHLPEIPSAKEIEKNGLMLAEMNISLLKKIEEMTLYMIEQNKQIIDLKNRLEKVESSVK